MCSPVVVVGSVGELAERFVARCEQAAAAAIAARGRFAWVIPGGSAAERLLPRLARASVDWSRTDVFFSDERFVPRSDAASSASAAARLLFDGLGAHGPRSHPMVEDAADPAAAARNYAGTLTAVLGPRPVPDLTLLGIGEDGHIASLFPGLDAVGDVSSLVLVEYHSPKPPSVRLTMSLPLLAASRAIVVAAFGEAKADVLRRVLHDPVCDLPAARLFRRAANVLLLLDPGAASRLAD